MITELINSKKTFNPHRITQMCIFLFFSHFCLFSLLSLLISISSHFYLTSIASHFYLFSHVSRIFFSLFRSSSLTRLSALPSMTMTIRPLSSLCRKHLPWGPECVGLGPSLVDELLASCKKNCLLVFLWWSKPVTVLEKIISFTHVEERRWKEVLGVLFVLWVWCVYSKQPCQQHWRPSRKKKKNKVRCPRAVSNASWIVKNTTEVGRECCLKKKQDLMSMTGLKKNYLWSSINYPEWN